MGLFEPGVNLEKEQKLIEKYSPYEWVKAWFNTLMIKTSTGRLISA